MKSLRNPEIDLERKRFPFSLIFMKTIHTIDCHYAGLDFVACSYLIVEGDRASFIETNTTHALPFLLGKLEELKIPKENVDYIIVTHVHLDHAGGASALLGVCPNAKILAHPKTAKHLINPVRLIQSSKMVYGEENFRKLYGEISPAPEGRVRVMSDREVLEWGKRKFTFYYTKGHANHHFCIHDSLSNSIFTGDSFGISYPHLENGKRFIFPTTTPTDFDYEEAVLSIDLIVNTRAEIAYLTHFDGVDVLSDKAQSLKHSLALCDSAIKGAANKNEEDLSLYFESKVKEMIENAAVKQGVLLTKKDWDLLSLDVNLNAQGLKFVALKNSTR